MLRCVSLPPSTPLLIRARCYLQRRRGCHSSRPRPMGAGLGSSLPPRGVSEARRRRGELSFFSCCSLWVHPVPPLRCLSQCTAAQALPTPGSAMDRGELLAVCVLCWSCSACVVTAIQRADLFPYGPLSGDSILAEGDDETSRVLSLPKPLYFYDSLFSQLYVSTAPCTLGLHEWLQCLGLTPAGESNSWCRKQFVQEVLLLQLLRFVNVWLQGVWSMFNLILKKDSFTWLSTGVHSTGCSWGGNCASWIKDTHTQKKSVGCT